MAAAVKVWLTLAALLGASAVILGALGSHALPVVDSARFRLANTYHLVHALALLGLCALGAARTFSPALHLAAVLLALGTVLFCGGVYAVALGAAPMARIAPVGGGLLILGWLVLALSPWMTRG